MSDNDSTTNIKTKQFNAKKRAYYLANRAAIRDRQRRYYAKNKKSIHAKAHSRYQAQRDIVVAKQCTYNDANRERINEKQRAYHWANRANRLDYNHAYYIEHKKEWAVSNRMWRQANPDKEIARKQRRRAHKANASINDFTAEQWQAMKAHYGYRCVYCGGKTALTQDHLTPLSKGGNHTAANIVPACQPCNSKKHTGPPLIPVQPLLI